MKFVDARDKEKMASQVSNRMNFYKEFRPKMIITAKFTIS